MKTAGIFVDVQNIYYTCRSQYGKSFNYRNLWQQLSNKYQIDLANAYAIHSGDDGQLKFQNALKHIGFNVRLKPYIQRSDGSAKGDWDVGITIDIMRYAENLDVVILLSGDGDFDLLLEYIKRNQQSETEVYGVEALTSGSLISSADRYYPILERDLMQALWVYSERPYFDSLPTYLQRSLVVSQIRGFAPENTIRK